jgi:hypothetical protein
MSDQTLQAYRPPAPYSEGWQNRIPLSMRTLRQWVLWRAELDRGRQKTTKRPYTFLDLSKWASTTNPRTWATFDDVARVFELGRSYGDTVTQTFQGVGLVFAPGDPHAGADFDHCLDENGRMLDWARPHFDALMPSYSEVSPSGRGVKVFVRGDLPDSGIKVGGFGPDGTGVIELYDRARFFTTTGSLFALSCVEVEDRDEAVNVLYAKLIEGRPKRDVQTPRPAPVPLTLSDREILERARKSKTGAEFSALYDRGDASRYQGDHSRADLALCSMLTFYFGGNADAMDRAFRGSALMRDKWNERRGIQTYGERTIDAALDGWNGKAYTPTRRPKIKMQLTPKSSPSPEANGQHHPEAQEQHQPQPAPAGPPPLTLDELRTRAAALVEANVPATVFRDEEFLNALAPLETTNFAEYSAILADLKRIKKLSVRDLLKTLNKIRTRLRIESGEAPTIEEKYVMTDGKTYREDATENGPIYVLLANFESRITEEITEDDGSETSIRFKVAGKLHTGRPLTAEVPATALRKMDWVAEQFGSEAIIEAQRGTADHLRAAIQRESSSVVRRTVYCHTGWRQDESGKWMYVHGGGAIKAAGLDASVSVNLEGPLRNYELPAPPEGDELRRVIRAFLDLLRLGQEERPGSRGVAAVAMCVPPRAALGAADFSIQCHGPSGTFKTSTAALMQQAFGKRMNARNGMPANWGSTANAIEIAMHRAACAVLVVDDFVPGGTDRDIAEQHRTAERVFRSQGNRSGRQRLNPDGSPKPDKEPRGLVVSTGEDRVRRKSADARTIPLHFAKGDPERKILGTIDSAVLTQCQSSADAGDFAGVMAAFLQWLAPRYQNAQNWILGRVAENRLALTRPGDHGRTPDILAELLAGFQLLLWFAIDKGAVTRDGANELGATVTAGLLEAAAEAKADQPADRDPGELFIELISAALTSKRAYLTDKQKDDAPEGMEATAGWTQEYKYQGGDIGQMLMWVHGPNAEHIGWTDGELVYLNPSLSYGAARKMYAASGEAFPVSAQTLRKSLADGRKLAMTDARNHAEGKNRLTARVSIQGRQREVLVIRAAEFWPPEADSPPGPATATVATGGAEPEMEEALA